LDTVAVTDRLLVAVPAMASPADPAPRAVAAATNAIRTDFFKFIRRSSW
jgi:hypothetical protein